jgi:integrase
MPAPSPRLPKYRHYLPKDLAVVRVNGRDVYLGRYDSPESHEKYRRVVAERLTTGAAPAARTAGVPGPLECPTVSELMVGYVRFADGYYVKNGRPTSESSLIRIALREFRKLYGHAPARDFGPVALKAVRQSYVEAGLCRRDVNRMTELVVRFFRWCVENELVPPSVHHGLKAVPGLRKGRTDVRDTEPVRPAPEEHVDAVLRHVPRQVRAMLELQLLTGMRPGEVVIMRGRDLDTSGRVWTYTPGEHKTEHHDKARTVYLGPKSQEVLRAWLRVDATVYLFQPREAMSEHRAALRAARKTPVQPSQGDRSKARPRKSPGDHYTVGSYRHAIQMACDKAAVPRWSQNQLRHSAATRLRREYGLDLARVIFGHSSPAVTAVYAEVDREKALRVMAEVG